MIFSPISQTIYDIMTSSLWKYEFERCFRVFNGLFIL